MKPVGTFKMIVPVPTSPPTDSAYTGPVREVHAPPTVPAEMALPPVAGVSVPALLLGAPSKASPKARVDAMASLFICLQPTEMRAATRRSPFGDVNDPRVIDIGSIAFLFSGKELAALVPETEGWQ